MLDTHAVARSLTDAEFTQAQADAITNAVRQAVEQSDHVTSDQFKAGLAEVQTQIANLDKRLSTEIAEMRAELAEMRAEQRAELAEMRAEQRAELAETRAEQRTEIAAVRSEIAEMRAEQRTEIAETRAEQRTEIAAIRTEIANLETRLIRWMVGTVITTATLTVGILRLLG